MSRPDSATGTRMSCHVLLASQRLCGFWLLFLSIKSCGHFLRDYRVVRTSILTFWGNTIRKNNIGDDLFF